MQEDSFFKTAQELDKTDSLATYKNHFITTDNLIYLDGNSLGKLPKKTVEINKDLIENQWGERLIQSWNENWLNLSGNIAKKLAQILGADESEILVGDSTSINLYKLAFAALNAQGNKTKIVTDSLNFPTDLYVFQGLIANHFKNHNLEIVESTNNISVDTQQIEKVLDNNTALLSLSLVTYKSAYLYPMKTINEIAKKHNTLVLWDLSHASGAIPVNLHKNNTDLAVGCTYKYLNGGPGAPAFLYVKKELQERLTNPIWSWFGHEKPFDFSINYTPSNSIQKFATGTPTIISMAAIEPGLEIILQAGIENIRKKSLEQTTFLINLIKHYLEPLNCVIASPMNANERGSHISVQHNEGYRINRALINPKNKTAPVIIPDFRPPNNIRLGIAPLYISFTDLYVAVKRIEEIIKTKEYEGFSLEKLTVT